MKKIILTMLSLLTLIGVARADVQPVLEAGPRFLAMQATDPTCQANTGVIYTKETAGVVELYYMTASPGCVVTKITAGGSTAGAVVFLGETTSTFDGNDMGAYTAIATRCIADMGDADARGCTDLDMALLVMKGGTFGGSSDEVWVQDGAPGYTSYSNDCDGWTSIAAGYYGAYWNLSTKKAYLSGCAMSKKYACCK